jgi:hypothetical protein
LKGVRKIVSNSFSEDEIRLLADICRILLRGGDPRQLVRVPAFKQIVRKQEAMSLRMKEFKSRYPNRLWKSKNIKQF